MATAKYATCPTVKLNCCSKIVITLFLSVFANFILAADKAVIDNSKTTTVVQTAQGEREVAKNPQRVAVLDLGVLDSLYALGVKIDAVQDNLFLPYLKRQAPQKLVPISTTHEPDIEALIRYQPDLIIIAQRTAAHYQALSKIAPTIDMTISGEDTILQLKQRLRDYGAIFNQQQRAKQLIEGLDNKLAAAKKELANSGAALFVAISGAKMSVFGAGSRFGWLFSDLGIKQAATGISADNRHGEVISFEFIRQVNPQWLLVFDRFAAIGNQGPAAKDVLDNALVRQTAAWQKQQLIYFDGAQYLAVGGLQAIELEIEQVVAAYRLAANKALSGQKNHSDADKGQN